MPSLFVTGASGNLGRQVVAGFLARGFGITALVRGGAEPPGCEVIRARLSEAEKYLPALEKAGAVIHLASTLSSDRNAVISEDILGTGRLIDGWRRGNFLYASAQVVYGVPAGDLTEETPLSPACWYDLGKICCEQQLAIAPPRADGGAGVSLRLPPFFGTGLGGAQFLPNLYSHLKRGRVFAFASEEVLAASGTSFIGPRDLAGALAAALELKRPGVYNLASGFCTWKELVGELGRAFGLVPRFAPLDRLPRGCEYVRLPRARTFVKADKFSGLTGFSPSQSVRELVDAFAENAGRARG